MCENRSPLVASSNPCCAPIIENVWHGKPAVRTSWGGNLSTSRMSPAGSMPKFALYVARASGAVSHACTHTACGTARVAPRWKLPIPQKRSTWRNSRSSAFCLLRLQDIQAKTLPSCAQKNTVILPAIAYVCTAIRRGACTRGGIPSRVATSRTPATPQSKGL